MKTKNIIAIEPTTFKNHSKLMSIFKINHEDYWHHIKECECTNILECISFCRGFSGLGLVEIIQEMKQAFPKVTEFLLNKDCQMVDNYIIYYDANSDGLYPSGNLIKEKALRNLHENFIIRTKLTIDYTEQDFETAIELVTYTGFKAYGSSVIWLEDNKLLVTRSPANDVSFTKQTSELYGVYGKDYM